MEDFKNFGTESESKKELKAVMKEEKGHSSTGAQVTQSDSPPMPETLTHADAASGDPTRSTGSEECTTKRKSMSDDMKTKGGKRVKESQNLHNAEGVASILGTANVHIELLKATKERQRLTGKLATANASLEQARNCVQIAQQSISWLEDQLRTANNKSMDLEQWKYLVQRGRLARAGGETDESILQLLERLDQEHWNRRIEAERSRAQADADKLTMAIDMLSKEKVELIQKLEYAETILKQCGIPTYAEAYPGQGQHAAGGGSV